MTIGIIGIGLIGGSMALELKAKGFAGTVLGVDSNQTHCDEALSKGIVDAIVSLEDAMQQSNVLILAIPVNAAVKIIGKLLEETDTQTVIMDTGSTKKNICEAIKDHPQRDRFVATHPIAGTEHSGPKSAHYGLFTDKVNIICEREKSNATSLLLAERLYSCLRMNTINMSAGEHDKHIAYVSHLSHISSFTLGLTVLAIEKDEKNIFNMAGSGFASTVRLAKSSPNMWAPIFEGNAENISVALANYIDQLTHFKKAIDEGNADEMYKLMEKANAIKRILENKKTTPQNSKPKS